jgi:hypothetical protein
MVGSNLQRNEFTLHRYNFTLYYHIYGQLQKVLIQGMVVKVKGNDFSVLNAASDYNI